MDFSFLVLVSVYMIFFQMCVSKVFINSLTFQLGMINNWSIGMSGSEIKVFDAQGCCESWQV